MDLNALREAAIEATSRALYDKLGIVPSDDSDQWEEEYRRQFAALRERHGVDLKAAAATARPAAASAVERHWPELRGTPEEQRWGASVRDERLREIPSEAARAFLVQTWPRAKQWIDTRDVPTQILLQRLKPQYDDWRRKQAEAAAARKMEAQKKAAAITAYQKRLQEAGITPEDLVELVDASERFAVAPIAAKLAEIAVEGRHLRVFETNDPNLLLVKEKKGPLQLDDYAIERDEGLVADLKLYGQAP
jgi:phosphotransacetylase